MGKLDGKVAVITGATSGMALAGAKLFVDEGAHVFISGRRKDALDEAVEQIGRNVTGVQADSADLANLDRLFATVKDQTPAAGVLPFRAETMPQVCALVLGDTPKRLDAVVPEVPKGLADVVARCLQKDPDLRYQNVAELAAELEPYGTELSLGASKRVSSMLRVPVPQQRDALRVLGAPISAETFGTSSPRRGVMPI